MAEATGKNSTTSKAAAPATDEDDFYDEATEAFPGKEDLKDRLVAVWALTRGTDKSPDSGKPYPFVNTVTLVLDDGPDGWSPTSVKDGESGPNLVPSVEDGPLPELNLRWSTEGMVTRLDPRIGKTFQPMLGRINSRPNKTKGRSPSWSIAKPTEDDKAIARRHMDAIKAVTARITKEATEAEDKAGFDE
jgi:hypothetical protein